MELPERLAVLVPPPRFHLVRYYGILAPRADLLRRVFAVEALTFPRCGQPMRVLAAIQSPEAIRAILECLGLPARPPPVAPPAVAFLLPDELPES